MKCYWILSALVVSFITGCSSEQSSPRTESPQAEVPQKAEPAPSQAKAKRLEPEQTGPAREGDHAPPTRSELRVMSEEAKAAEGAMKTIVDRFDANLSDRSAREAAESDFKALLPEYKEKMLEIGKARLRGQADAEGNQ